jgi:hypothetical protein
MAGLDTTEVAQNAIDIAVDVAVHLASVVTRECSTPHRCDVDKSKFPSV